MSVTRRQFVKGGAAAFTMTFAAPAFISDLARAQGAHTRNFVVLNLSGVDEIDSTGVSTLLYALATARKATTRVSAKAALFTS